MVDQGTEIASFRFSKRPSCKLLLGELGQARSHIKRLLGQPQTALVIHPSAHCIVTLQRVTVQGNVGTLLDVARFCEPARRRQLTLDSEDDLSDFVIDHVTSSII